MVAPPVTGVAGLAGGHLGPGARPRRHPSAQVAVNHGAEASRDGSYPAEFDRVEAAVDAGQTDLRALGFWRLLAGVKADQALATHWAEQAGRIDRKAFERGVRFRLPVWFGNLVLVLGIVLGGVAVGIAFAGRVGAGVRGPGLVGGVPHPGALARRPRDGDAFPRVLRPRPDPAGPGPQDRLRDLPPRPARGAGVDARLGRDREQDRPVPGARVLAG